MFIVILVTCRQPSSRVQYALTIFGIREIIQSPDEFVGTLYNFSNVAARTGNPISVTDSRHVLTLLW
jgi:hypothetical protein